MNLAIAITVAKRAKETFTESIASLRAAGFDQRVHVFADGVRPQADGCEFTFNNPSLGGLKNWCFALETLMKNSDAEWLMMLEDDITWAAGSAQALERDIASIAQMDRVGYLSLYLPRWNAKRMKRGSRLEPGLHEYNMDNSWGSQAYVLPRKSAHTLLEDTKMRWYRSYYKPNKNRDLLVSRCLREKGLKLLHRVPCLVDHKLGAGNSSLSKKFALPNLVTDYFTGHP